MTSAIIALGVLYFAGHGLAHVFHTTKVPDVLILIIMGILLGPVFNFVDSDSIGPAGDLFTSVALIVILFEGGLGLELTTILRSATQALKLTISFFFLTTVIIAAIMYFGFGYTPLASVLLGFICGGTSSAVVIPMIEALKVGSEASTILILESALTDVLCIVFTLGTLSSYHSGAFELGKIIGTLLSSLVFAMVIGVVGGLVWLRLHKSVRSDSHTQFATFAFMFIVYGVAETLNFSGPIAALAFGIVLGNFRIITHFLSRVTSKIDYDNMGVISDAERKLYKEIVFLIKIFFFVYLGMSIPLEQLYAVGIGLSIVLALYVFRPLMTGLLVKNRVTAYDKSIISVMVPKGLAAAVLAGLPSQYDMIEGSDIQAITYNVVLFSIILTSVLIPVIERTSFGDALRRLLGDENPKPIKND